MTLNKDHFLDLNKTYKNKDGLSWYDLLTGDDKTSEENLINQIIKFSDLDSWAGVWHIFGASQALSIDIKPFYPDLNSEMVLFLNKPLSCNDKSQGINI